MSPITATSSLLRRLGLGLKENVKTSDQSKRELLCGRLIIPIVLGDLTQERTGEIARWMKGLCTIMRTDFGVLSAHI